ncbi:MAG: WG repeat-containing protein [Fischerella sp.]|nr:WG repeat-containing protein [Fischerella sp.]
MLVNGTILRNHYQIVQQLGSGGFADTYLAKDMDLPTHAQCVVKHLKPTSPDPSVLPIARRLFETEAQVLYQLGQNDRIPRLFAHFEENGEFYLVQEFVDGHDLSKELTPGRRFSENEVVKLLQEILEVLAIVHQRNIIHRDIKPQNLMRRRSDGKIVLIDFGAVKEIGSLAMNTQGQVRSTIAIGTPGYMPTEQANRDPKLCSDIYAVGMIGIQALTGLMPQQLLLDNTTGELIWRNYVQVSDKLANILTTMVRYHFSQRYQSASEALQALNAIIPQSQPHSQPFVSSKLTTIVSQIPKPLLWGSLIGIGGLGIGVISIVALLSRSPSPPPVTTPTPTSIASSPTPADTSTAPTSPTSSENVNFAIQPQFDGVGSFSEGLAEVKVDGKWGYIDKSGNIVIQPQFDETDKFSEGLAKVWIAGQNWGYIDKTGNFVIPQQFAKDGARNFSEGLARACVVSTCGFIDKTGNFVIERKFTGAGDFKEGLARVKTRGKWGFIDKSGNLVVQPQFEEAYNFSEGLAIVKINNKYSYIDSNGNFVIQTNFDDVFYFSEELALVKVGDKYGYIDKTGKMIIQPEFDDAYNFSEGLARIKTNGKWGYIDKRGTVAIQPQFTEAYNFSEELALVKVDNKWGYINKNGNFVIQPQFEDAGSFFEGLAWIEVGDKIGYIRNPLTAQ